MQIKSELRKELLEKRKKMQSDAKESDDKAIFEAVKSLQEFKNADLILTYASTLIEVDTRRLIEYCFEKGKNVAVPKCVENDMEFYYITSLSELEAGYMGILEPKSSCKKVAEIYKNTVCITPALAVNESGYRIGYGKGFYDRFLSKNDCISVALCYDNSVMDFTQQIFDVPVNILITEKKSWRIYG